MKARCAFLWFLLRKFALLAPLLVFSGKCLATDAWIFIPTQSAAQAQTLRDRIFGGQDIQLTPRETPSVTQEFANFMIAPLTHRHFLFAYGSPFEAMDTRRLESFANGLLLRIRVDLNFRNAPRVLAAFRAVLDGETDPGGLIRRMLTGGPVIGNLYASPISQGGFVAGFDGTNVPHTAVIDARILNANALAAAVPNPSWDAGTPTGPNPAPVHFTTGFTVADTIQIIQQAAAASIVTVAAVCVAYWALTDTGSGYQAASQDAMAAAGTCANVDTMDLKKFVGLEERYRARFSPAVTSIITTF